MSNQQAVLTGASPEHSRIRERFRNWFLLASLLIVLGGISVAYFFLKEYESELRQDEAITVERAWVALNHAASQPIEHLKSLAFRERNSQRVFDGQLGKDALVESFSTLLMRNPSYSQVRWIGDDGKERLRLERTATGEPRNAPAGELQDKRGRYYVVETLQLARGEIYVSPLDLNVENGKVETPFRPMIRFGTRVFRGDGSAEGMLILNVSAQAMLAKFAEAGLTHNLMLLNAAGYWLKSPRPEDEWGFMFDKPVTLGARAPRAWSKIGSQQEGQIETASGLWTWKTAHVTTPEIKQANQVYWKVVSTISSASLTAMRQKVWVVIACGEGILLLIFGLGFRKIVTEVEARQSAEEAVQHESMQLRSVVDLSPNGLAIFDSQLHLKVYNTPFPEITGISKAVLDQPGFDFGTLIAQYHARGDYPGRTLEQVLEPLLANIRDRQSLHYERTTRDGRILDIHVITLPDGRILLSYRDVTVEREYTQRLEHEVGKRTEELATAKVAAEAANVAKSNFMGNMSHEMRTPLHQMLGLADLLRREPLSEKQTGRLDRIVSAGNRLNVIIEGILNLTDLESRQLALKDEPLDVNALMAEVKAAVQDRATEKRLEFGVDAGDFPLGLSGDAAHLKTALLCYVNNAITFTEAGSVHLRAQVVEEDSAVVKLRFAVRDTGIGIASDVLPRLFNIFEQADNSSTRKYGGTGVGLFLVKKLAQKMGGDAGCESRLGEGSTFWLTVRLKKADGMQGGAAG